MRRITTLVLVAMDTADLMSRLYSILSRRGDVRLALLFGSRARGNASAASDIDLAVDAPETEISSLAADLSGELGTEVDVLSLQDATIPMNQALVRDGIVVYEAAPHIAASWRSHVLIDLETDRPWYRRMRDAWLRHVADEGLEDGR